MNVLTTYKTAEVAAVIGVHPNTVRLYEEWGLIPAAKRQKNGYRVFTAFHIQQFWLARTAFQIEVLQGGLRKKIVEVVKLSAQGNFDGAILLTREYVTDLGKERDHAEEAICIVQHILSGDSPDTPVFLKRKETSDYLGISMDTLRNWEMNGLLTIKRKQNGYRVYSEQDIRRLKIIRSLCAISVCAGGLMGLPLVVAEYRERKILKRFQVTPVSPSMLLSGYC